MGASATTASAQFDIANLFGVVIFRLPPFSSIQTADWSAPADGPFKTGYGIAIEVDVVSVISWLSASGAALLAHDARNDLLPGRHIVPCENGGNATASRT
jgi:hypothetical protein